MTPEGTLATVVEAIETQQNSTIVLIRVPKGEDDEGTRKNLIGGIDPDTGDDTGIQAFRSAESAVHVVPKVLIAPGFFGAGTAEQADPLLAALIPIAEKLHAIVVADGPNSTTKPLLPLQKSRGTLGFIGLPRLSLTRRAHRSPSHLMLPNLFQRLIPKKGFGSRHPSRVLSEDKKIIKHY